WARFWQPSRSPCSSPKSASSVAISSPDDYPTTSSPARPRFADHYFRRSPVHGAGLPSPARASAGSVSGGRIDRGDAADTGAHRRAAEDRERRRQYLSQRHDRARSFDRVPPKRSRRRRAISIDHRKRIANPPRALMRLGTLIALPSRGGNRHGNLATR